jgi:hypothetical protein
MMLIPHIIIALSSILYTGYVFVKPSKNKFYVSYSLIAATLATGTYLVIMMPAHLVSACFTGIAYLAFVTAGIVAAHKRYVASEVKN